MRLVDGNSMKNCYFINPMECALLLQGKNPLHQGYRIGIADCRVRRHGNLPTRAPFLTFATSLATALLSPEYFFATSMQAGPANFLSTAWNARH